MKYFTLLFLFSVSFLFSAPAQSDNLFSVCSNPTPSQKLFLTEVLHNELEYDRNKCRQITNIIENKKELVIYSTSRITDFSLMRYFTGLEKFVANGIHFETVNFLGHLSKLKKLRLFRAKIDKPSPLTIPNLESVEIIKVKNFNYPVLKTINCLHKIKIAGNVRDVGFIIKHDNLRDLALIGIETNKVDMIGKLTNLDRLAIIRSSLSNIGFLRSLENLTFLDLKGNKITDIDPLRNLSKLENLNLNRNEIRNLEPISGLTGLKVLSLSENHIDSVRYLRNIVNIEYLHLDFNQINDLTPLVDLKKINSITVSGNKLKNCSPKDLQELKIGKPRC